VAKERKERHFEHIMPTLNREATACRTDASGGTWEGVNGGRQGKEAGKKAGNPAFPVIGIMPSTTFSKVSS